MRDGRENHEQSGESKGVKWQSSTHVPKCICLERICDRPTLCRIASCRGLDDEDQATRVSVERSRMAEKVAFEKVKAVMPSERWLESAEKASGLSASGTAQRPLLYQDVEN